MKIIICSVFVLLVSQNAWTWGSLGHKTSAQIAWNLLDKNTKAKISDLLNDQKLVDIATWADSARAEQQWKHTVWYHFEKAPDNYSYLDNLKRQDDKYKKLGGLIEALYVAEENLTAKKATAVDKENAVKFLVHFIADIHQPLHTGRVEDNSGNKIPMKWLGLDVNLHQIWDSQIIYFGHRDLLNGANESEQIQKYSDYLQTKFKNFKVTPDLFRRYDDWMHESMVPRADAYNYKDESEEAYTSRFIDIIDLRLYLAGLRIAQTLSRIANGQTQNEPLQQLKNSIVKIVGDFYDFVDLKPRPTTLSISSN